MVGEKRNNLFPSFPNLPSISWGIVYFFKTFETSNFILEIPFIKEWGSLFAGFMTYFLRPIIFIM
jgi:hypothetical protein